MIIIFLAHTENINKEAVVKPGWSWQQAWILYDQYFLILKNELRIKAEDLEL